MLSLFKPRWTFPLPTGTQIVTHKGNRGVWVKRRGEKVFAQLCPNNPARCYLESERWYIRQGRRKPIPAFKDRKASEALAFQVETDSERTSAGLSSRLLQKSVIDARDEYLAELERGGAS